MINAQASVFLPVFLSVIIIIIDNIIFVTNIFFFSFLLSSIYLTLKKILSLRSLLQNVQKYLRYPYQVIFSLFLILLPSVGANTAPLLLL